MQDKVFLDTNVLIYVYSIDEKEKRKRASELLDLYKGKIIISNQVINEIANTLFKKFSKKPIEVEDVIHEISSEIPIFDFHLKTQVAAIQLKERFSLQFYDSLILATALEYGCNKVFSKICSMDS